ncbi:hypothetical protein D1BOALGB6SA_10207 [Olavius sp. associated proteobacterium Delta 1]|nr:hypothetical protein D1BOALGB6SA_10207 [Olavius sp. associated proteobacterium Delta 1]
MGSDIIADKQSGFARRKILRAVLSGIGGNIVILVFLMTFLHIFETIRFMPWILAFNSALTGFALADKTGRHPAYLKTISAIAGLFNVAATCGIFAAASVLLFGDLYLAPRDIGFFVAVGVVCSELGSLLAIKYYRN